jgi:hypothetical protein
LSTYEGQQVTVVAVAPAGKFVVAVEYPMGQIPGEKNGAMVVPLTMESIE